MKFNKKIKTIFLDPNSSEHMNDEQVNVILSPSLYWVKKISLPIKNVKDAQKLLPSIFEDTLPEGYYNYFVYKKENIFFAFAYEDKIILDLLSEKGISASNIENVYFAQSELSFINGTLKINKTEKICLKDGIVILLCDWVEEGEDVDLESIELSKNSIVLSQFGHIVDSNSLYIIWLILIMLIVLVITEYLITSQKVEELSILRDNLYTKNNLQPTTLQNKNILKKYTTIHSKQIKLRKYISALLSLKLKSDESLKQITLKDNILAVEFSVLCDTSIKMVLDTMKFNRVEFKAEKRAKTWYLEMII